MASIGIASRTTYVSATTSATMLVSGNPCIITGITVTSGANRVVTFRRPNAGATLFIIRVLASTTFVMDVPFVCDTGVEVITDGTTADVTFFHHHPGR